MRPALRRDRSESGYVALVTAMLFVIIFGMAAFAVDVGRWYVTAKQEQRAADAAALGGVPNLPGDTDAAFDAAFQFSAANDFTDGDGTIKVVPSIDGSPTRLRVTVTKTVDNIFGGLLGVPKTTITRSAVADYFGPVPMGSPCNAYGNDPEGAGVRSANCSGTGAFWANVGSGPAPKRNGDAYQNGVCASSDDGCNGATNEDYDPNGYFYSVTLDEDVDNLTFEAFDPALIDVGDYCEKNNLAGAMAIPAASADVPDPATRYFGSTNTTVSSASPYCTGDIRFGGSGEVTTQFSVRDTGGNLWDPLSFPVYSGACVHTYAGFSGNLAQALDRTNGSYRPDVSDVFRRWKTLCTISDAPAGTYMIQVKTNGLGTDAASGHNRFALRAYSTTDPAAKDVISVAGYNKMAMYANLPSATTSFHLARVPSGAAGQILNVKLFDVGDASSPGTITVLAPSDSGVTFSGCTGSGPAQGSLAGCAVTADSSNYQGKWQTISVPIPEDYTCDDSDNTGCWVKLRYEYGSGNQPNDTTSWQASLGGDPVRLVE